MHGCVNSCCEHGSERCTDLLRPVPSAAPAALPLAHPDFTVVTYNILADQYASSEKGINKLFSYCPRRFVPL
jgi:mRNA deadenylase 3'-5' endonuclease subunit Ccr4